MLISRCGSSGHVYNWKKCRICSYYILYFHSQMKKESVLWWSEISLANGTSDNLVFGCPSKESLRFKFELQCYPVKGDRFSCKMFLKAKFYFAQPYATSRVPIYILSKPEWPNMTELAFSVKVVSLEKKWLPYRVLFLSSWQSVQGRVREKIKPFDNLSILYLLSSSGGNANLNLSGRYFFHSVTGAGLWTV